MQVAFYFAGEITEVLDANPWVRCASGNVFDKLINFKGKKKRNLKKLGILSFYRTQVYLGSDLWVRVSETNFKTFG